MNVIKEMLALLLALSLLAACTPVEKPSKTTAKAGVSVRSYVTVPTILQVELDYYGEYSDTLTVAVP